MGFLNSAVGIGGLFGAVAAFALVGRQRLASDFAFGLLLWGIPIALIGIFPRPPLALFLLAIVGVGNTVVDVAALTLLQRTVPDEVLTRVFGVIQSVFIGTVGLGAIFAPLMINAVGIRWALILTGALLPLSAGSHLASDHVLSTPTSSRRRRRSRCCGRCRSSSRSRRRRSTTLR